MKSAYRDLIVNSISPRRLNYRVSIKDRINEHLISRSRSQTTIDQSSLEQTHPAIYEPGDELIAVAMLFET